LHNIFFILFNNFYMIIDFYYKLILINKFIKHNQENDSCCDIKYIDLYLFLNFLILFLFIVNDFFFHLFTQLFLICLIRCDHKFFYLHLEIFYVKEHVEKFYMFSFFIRH
jgi:hypothetical protein